MNDTGAMGVRASGAGSDGRMVGVPKNEVGQAAQDVASFGGGVGAAAGERATYRCA